MSTYEDWEADADAAAFIRQMNNTKEAQDRFREVLKQFHWSVELDGNLLHIAVNVPADEAVTIIMPHVRGVSPIHQTYGHYRYCHDAGFHLMMHKSQEPIHIGSGNLHVYVNTDSYHEFYQAVREKLALVRQDVLSALNEFYSRPYIGEQYKMKF